MSILIDESVGTNFKESDLIQARDITLNVIQEAFEFVKPGLTEDEMKTEILNIQKKYNIPQTWHAPQVRFGINTTLPYGVPGQKNISLKDEDILFLDLGLIHKGHEGDVGRPMVIGNNPEMLKCKEDVQIIWDKVKEKWETTNLSGEGLYKYASQIAEQMGWLLSLKKANGHRIADFPHAVKTRGTIEALNLKPSKNRWILEIQILHPDKTFGAFYEDLLN